MEEEVVVWDVWESFPRVGGCWTGRSHFPLPPSSYLERECHSWPCSSHHSKLKRGCNKKNKSKTLVGVQNFHFIPTLPPSKLHVMWKKRILLFGLIPYDFSLWSFEIKVFKNCNSQIICPENIIVSKGDSLIRYSKGIGPKEIFHWASIYPMKDNAWLWKCKS